MFSNCLTYSSQHLVLNRGKECVKCILDMVKKCVELRDRVTKRDPLVH